MLFIILAGAVLVGLIRRGKLINLTKTSFVHPWLIFLSIVLETCLILLSKYNISLDRFAVFICITVQYILLFAFVLFNRNLPYIWLIGTGSLLNSLVILLNKGTMPLAGSYLDFGKTNPAYDFLLNGNLPLYHIIDENTVLWFLGDIIRIPSPFSAFMSIGDIILYAGVFLMLQSIIAGKTE